MKEGVKLWFFILLIPFFLSIGHDLFANYYLDAQKRTRLEAFQIDPKAYQISDAGYLFMKYMPETFETTRNAIGEETWVKWVDPILRLYTFVIALVPAILFAIWHIVSALLDIRISGPKRGTGSQGTSPYKRDKEPQGPMKYKRR